MSGNKTELKTRLIEKLDKTKKLIKIQKTFRGHLARLWIKLKKGTGDPSVNDTDFYTFEPLNEIPYLNFIKYVDVSNNFSYGFDIKSLCMMAIKTKKFELKLSKCQIISTLSFMELVLSFKDFHMDFHKKCNLHN